MWSASGHSRDDADDIAIAQRRIQARDRTHVVAADEDIDIRTNLAGFDDNPLQESRVVRTDLLERRADRFSIGCKSIRVAYKRPERNGDSHGYVAHLATTAMTGVAGRRRQQSTTESKRDVIAMAASAAARANFS